MGIQTSETQSLGCYATGEVAVDGATVTVGMGKYCPPARAGLTARNYVIYFRRADGGDGSLRDMAGNLLAPDGDAGVGLYVKIDLDNVTGGAPRVTGVAVVSDAGADQTYGAGDEIEVRVTFDGPVDVTGTPRLKIDMDPAEWGEKWAAYDRGSGTASLTFVHTVAAPNLSTQGIAVLANTLELGGGTIRAGGAAADVAHAGLAHDANHKVDWQRAAEREPLTARFVDVPATHGGGDSAFSFGLEFSEALERQLSSATLRNEALRATNATVTRTKRVVKGDNRRWTVTVRPESGAEVTVSLPATADCAAVGALCTADGRGLSKAVTATVSPAAPSVTGVSVVSTPGGGDSYALGETVRVAVTFSEAVTVTGAPRLKLDLGAGARKWAEYAEGSGTAELEFAWTVARGDASGGGVAVPADTLELNGGGIRAAARDQDADLAHAGLASDASHKVDGAPDTTPPRLSATAVAGTKLTLSFDEAIDAAAPPTSGAFTVKRTPPGRSEQSVGLSGSPAIEGARVTLTLAEAVRGADTDVKVSYRKSGSDTGNRLRDAAGNEVAAFSDEPVANVNADTTPPELVRGEIDGGTVTLYFSEPLDPDSTGGTFEVIVQTAITPWKHSQFDATGEVSINGRTVTVGLGGGNPRAIEGGADNFKYFRPTDPAAMGLRDLAGNAVRTPHRVCISDWCWWYVGIDLDNITIGPPSVTGVGISSDAGADRSYALGEKIQVTLTFSEAVVVTGAPRVKIDLDAADGGEPWAVYETGSGTRTLEFVYTVAEGDTSSMGVAVLANTLELNGGTIKSTRGAGESARLAHAGFAPDPNHRVDTSPPTLSVASVNGRTLRVTFDEPLGAAASLANGAFTVKKTPQGGGEQEVSLSGSPVIDSATVTLTLANPVLNTDTDVKVSYRRSDLEAGNRLRDAAGNEVAGFSDEPVTKVAGDTTPPRLVRGEIDGGTMTVYFSEPLDPDSVGGIFRVGMLQEYPYGHATFTAAGDVEVSGNAVTVGLRTEWGRQMRARAGFPNNSASYLRSADPTAMALRDLAGNPVETPRVRDEEWLETRIIVLDNLTPAPSTVTGVEVSSDAGDDDTYALGEKIQVTLTFSEAVTVTGTPRAKIDFSSGAGDEQWADYEEGSGTETLHFAYEVAEPNVSTEGIAVLANTLALNGGAIESASTAGENAALAHAGLGHDPAHRVNWQASPGGSPSVPGVAVTSDAGVDATYGFGETIRVTVTFSGAVTVTGSPVLSIDMDPAAWGEKRAAYESGSGTAALVFAYEVVEPNVSTQGIAVLADSLALNGGTIRSAAGQADAALGHSGLGHDAAHKVDWRPLISVADARAEEGAGAKVAFEVSLSRAFTRAEHAVTVDYATTDGAAKAGEDYTATSGTLTFAAGETAKTVNVAVLDDAVDEGEETFVLRLSNATGGRIGDGEATGTIANDDPLQKMWLSRFGRTVAGHVTDAVSDRLGAPLTGARVTVGGQSVVLAQAEDVGALRQALTAVARALGASEQPASGEGTAMGVPGSPTRDGAPAGDVSGRELLLGSAFHLAGEDVGAGPGLAAWGRVTFGGFDGEERADAGRLRIDGEVTTGILGADVAWNGLLAGVAVSVNEGEGTFSQPGVDTGKIESRMTAVSPYARLKLNERISVWGLAGWGIGEMTIEQAANEKQVERVTRTDIEMRVGALGGRGALLESDETGGVDLGLKADAFYVETEAEAFSNKGGTTAVASRVRLALEGSGSWEAGGGVLTPGLEFGVRHDGGDAETGTGVEIGGSVRYTNPAAGLRVEARVRTLVAHEDSEYREWGASGAVRLAPGDRGRGVSFSLAPTYGRASSGVDRLWSARDARGLTPGDGGVEPERRLEGELGYGLALFGDRFTGTPNLGFGMSDGSRDYRIGWRLTSAVSGDPGFEVSLDATRRETAGDNGPVSGAEHGVMLRGAIRW